MSVVSCYLPNSKIPNLKVSLIKALEAITGPILLLGDGNGHHTAWGSKKSNARGQAIVEVGVDLGLTILNDGSPTFIRSSETAIDISLATHRLTSKLLWDIEDDPMGSDHLPIWIHLNDRPPATSRRPRWQYVQADWDAFQIGIEEGLDNTEPTTMDELVSLIAKVAQATIPKSSDKPGRRATHWWSEDTKKAVKARRKALRAARRIPPGAPRQGNSHPKIPKRTPQMPTNYK